MTDWATYLAEEIGKEFPECPIYYLDPPYEDSPSPYIRIGQPDSTVKALKGATRGQHHMNAYIWDSRVDHQDKVVQMMNELIDVIEKALDKKNALLYQARRTIGYDTTTATTWIRGGLDFYFKTIGD